MTTAESCPQACIEQMDCDLRYTGYGHGFDHLRMNASEGALKQVYAAFDRSFKNHDGAYLANNQAHEKENVLPWLRDSVSTEQLWNLREELTGQKFDY